MDISCVAEIWVPGLKRVGSGYLLADRLILTSWHVVEDVGPDGRIQVRLLDDKEQAGWLSASLAWPSESVNLQATPQRDAALLYIDDRCWQPPKRRAAVRFGRVSGTELVRFLGVGFPDAEARPDGSRDTMAVRGHVDPLQARKSRMLTVHVDEGIVPRRLERASGWAGASGTALFSGSLLIGVLAADRNLAEDASVLSAVPVTALADLPGFRNTLRAHRVKLRFKDVSLESARLGLPSPESADAICPYPGLAAFTSGQAQWFFGRKQVTADLLSRLDAAVAGGGPVMVVAASGAGKSSLLQAGLLHQVASGALAAAGSKDWPQVVIVPGAHPMRAAAAALAGALPAMDASRPPPDPGADDLDALLHYLARCTTGSGGVASRVVLAVDQFEELFTLCESEAERTDFITWLWRAADPSRAGGPLAVVACGLRADFYAHCVTGYSELRESLQTNQVVVGPMSPDELREAIISPAQKVGLDVEPGLADLLLADLRASRDGRAAPGPGEGAMDYDAGRLPLLAHALRATWQQRTGKTLTVRGYRVTGGIDHAIAETADRVYAQQGQAGQVEVKLMFLRLVKIGDTPSEDARRSIARSGLATSSAADAVLDACIGNRLLTSTQDAVQITHEALLSAWPKLKRWLEEERAGDLIRQRIEEAATEWERASRDGLFQNQILP